MPYSSKSKYCYERVKVPSAFAKKSFRTISVGEQGKKITVGCPKGKYKKGRCSVGMQLQRKLRPVGSKGCKIGGREMKKNPYNRWYVGKTRGGDHRVFSSVITPTQATHREFTKVCGPYVSADSAYRDKPHAIVHMGITCRDNPPPQRHRSHKRTVVYDDLLALEAVKGKRSKNFPHEKFRHDFTVRGTRVIGMPDGTLKIVGKKPLWEMFNY